MMGLVGIKDVMVGKSYTVGDTYYKTTDIYKTLVNHTASANIQDDITAGYIVKVTGFPEIESSQVFPEIGFVEALTFSYTNLKYQATQPVPMLEYAIQGSALGSGVTSDTTSWLTTDAEIISWNGRNFNEGINCKYVIAQLGNQTSNRRDLVFPELLFVSANLGNTGAPDDLTTISMPKLDTTYGVAIFCWKTSSFPALKYIVRGVTLVRTISVDLPLVEYIGLYSGIQSIISTVNNATWTTCNIGPNLKQVLGDVIITSNTLDEASVNNILIRLANLDGTNGTTIYGAGKTVTITGGAATPTGLGATAKTILQGRGVIVTTN